MLHLLLTQTRLYFSVGCLPLIKPIISLGAQLVELAYFFLVPLLRIRPRQVKSLTARENSLNPY